MNIDYYLVSSQRRAFRLRPGKDYVIGREQGVEIQIHDAMASRRHALLRFSSATQAWEAADLGSRNGVFVNQQRITGQQALRDQDRLQVAGQIFAYQLVPPGCDVGTLGQQAPEISDQVTMAPGLSVADLATREAAFSGKIGPEGLLELLQFLALTRKTGRLDLLAGARLAGSAWVAAGALREASHGSERGFSALAALARTIDLTFAFHAGADIPEAGSLKGSAEGVLMELARLMDEGNRRK